MTDLNAKIVPLQSETAGLAPTDAQCDVGEIAVNLTDRKIYSKRSDGTIVTLAGGSKIQDAEDFDFNKEPAVGWRYEYTGTNQSQPPAGEVWQFTGYTSNTLAFSTIDLDGEDRSAELYALEDGDTVRLLDEDGFLISESTIDGPYNKNSNRITIEFVDGLDKPPAGSIVLLDLYGGERADIPLKPGDAIVWEAARGEFPAAFRPRQFRVDKLLDVVVPLDQATTPGWKWLWGADDNQYQPAGDFGGFSGVNSIQFSVLDADGVDRTDQLLAMTTGETLWMQTVAGGTWASYEITAVPTNFGPGSEPQSTIGITAPGTYAAVSGLTQGHEVRFYLGETPPEGTDGRLDRDVLQWNTADAKYHSQPLLFDITAAQDFAFVQANPATPRWDEGDWLEDGEFTRTATQWIFNLTDAVGTDRQPFFEQWAAAESIWHSGDGISWSTSPFNQLEVKTNTGTCEITFDDPAPAVTASLFIAFSEPGIEIDQPIADGMVMVWNGTHWTPENITEGLALGLNDLTDVNTITNPPTDGQALVWDATNGYWKPGNVATDGGGAEALGDLSDVTLGTPQTGQVLQFNGSEWQNAALSYSDLGDTPDIPQVIDDLDDVDTSTVPPTPGQVLTWDGSNWAPATATGGGGARETVGGALTERADVTVTTDYSATGTEAIEFTGLGEAGSFVQVTATQPCWVRFYGTEIDRTSDALRPVDQDPQPGSGVLLEVRIPIADEVVTVSPGALYYNNDTLPEQTLYALVTNDSGQAAAIGVTVRAYTQTHTDAIVGGTFGSG